MDTKRNITKLSFIVLAQVGLFIMTYLTTIAIGAGLVCTAFYATIYGVPFFFEDIAPMLLRFGKIGDSRNNCMLYCGYWLMGIFRRHWHISG